jgi:inorganic phosphate transporter, PiT family
VDFLAVFALAAAFTIAAGFNDGGNLLAATAASRTIAAPRAFILIVVCAAAGPLLFGTAVARTIGTGIADFHAVGLLPLCAGIAGAIAAVGFAYVAEVPTSMSIALVGSMIGALATGPGLGFVHWPGVERVVVSMLASVIVGGVAGALFSALLTVLLVRVRWSVGERLMSLQYVTAALLSLGYGANDLEKSVGLLAAATGASTFVIPGWSIAVAVACFAVGLAFGGLRVAKTVGGKMFLIRPYHALAFQSAAAATVIGAALAGGPLSTTQTSASAMAGVGAVQDVRGVHWLVVQRIAVSWLVTIPVALAAGSLAGLAVRLIR